MNSIKLLVRATGCALLLTLTPSCVAGWILSTGKKPVIPHSKAEAVKTYGEPIAAGPVPKSHPIQKYTWIDPEPKFEKRTGFYVNISRSGGLKAYEIYQYRGLMRDEDLANASAMTNAITLGTSEALFIPLALANRASGISDTHNFLALYDGRKRLVEFQPVEEHTMNSLPRY